MIQASAPALAVTSAMAPLPESERMEVLLKQRLHERKLSQVDTPQPIPNSIANITPPPTSSSHSDKCTIESSEETTGDRLALRLQTPSTSDDRHSYRRGHATAAIDLERRLAEDPETSRNYDRVNDRIQPERLITSFSHRSSSPPQTPPGSPQRARSTSPARAMNIDTNEETVRGRARSPRSKEDDDEASYKSRSPSPSRRSHSPSARSRSLSRDSRYSNPSLHRDDIVVERVSRSRSRSPPPRRSPREEMFDARRQGTAARPYATDNVSLKHRISDQLSPSSPTKRFRHRICPFFHPREGDRHPLDRPHPGYTAQEFNEAVGIHESGHNLPSRLIKPGVSVNLQNKGAPSHPAGPSWANRGNTSPTALRNTRGPLAYHTSYGGGETHVEPPMKRRRVEMPERQDHYRRESGSSYNSTGYAIAGDSMPLYSRHNSSQYPLTTGMSNTYSRPGPRMMDPEPPRVMRPTYRRYASDHPKY